MHSFVAGDLKVNLANRGALIQAITLKGSNMVKAYDNAEDFKSETNPFFGTTIGRYANRISNGEFKLNGKVYKLTKMKEQTTCMVVQMDSINKISLVQL